MYSEMTKDVITGTLAACITVGSTARGRRNRIICR